MVTSVVLLATLFLLHLLPTKEEPQVRFHWAGFQLCWVKNWLDGHAHGGGEWSSM